MNPLATMLFGQKQGHERAAEQKAQNYTGNANTAAGWQTNGKNGMMFQTPEQMMGALRANPGEMLRGAGYNVPDDMAGNPQGMVMHLIQSGQVSGPMMQRIQPFLQRMGMR